MQTIAIRRNPALRRRGMPMMAAITILVSGILAAACSDSTGPENVPGVASVSITPGSGTLDVGDQLDLRAIVRSNQGDTLSGHAVSWASSDTTVVKVTAAGRATALKTGSAVVTASVSGRSGQSTITVRPATPVAPAITALEPASIAAGGPAFTLTIRGTGFVADSRLQWNGAARPTTYVSATEVHATISSNDIATVGTARIFVVNPTAGGPSNEVAFAVEAQTVPVMVVELSRSIAITRVGQAVPVAATVRDANGNVLSNRLVTWSSGNQLVATVNGNGVVAPTGEGVAVITATSEGRTATLALNVVARPYDLIFDDAGSALSMLDLRTGTQPVRFWEHAAGIKAIHPSVSPDRRYYAYVLDMGGSRDIAILDIAARTYHWITNDGTSDQPEWSPSGDRIVFRSSRAGRPDVWTMAPDGSAAFNVTHSMPSTLAAGDPTWSPDGNSIAMAVGPINGNRFLYVIRADGTGQRILQTPAGSATEPTWMFDDIFFTLKDAAGQTNIWRVSASGAGAPTFRFTDSGRASMPSMSPDGRWVAFVDGAAGSTPARILAVQPQTGEIRPLFVPVSAAGSVSNPTWLRHE